jgi:hypothetical protein
MKIKIFMLGLLCLFTLNAQSVITLGAGTSLELGTGADFCSGTVEGTGTLSGNGTFCGGPTDVESVEFMLPSEFSLNQNYPNPFNPATRINWQLPFEGNVKLKVYDALGNVVVTLVDEYKNAGYYESLFDAAGLSSGIYFYSLQSGNYLLTRKMILVK